MKIISHKLETNICNQKNPYALNKSADFDINLCNYTSLWGNNALSKQLSLSLKNRVNFSGTSTEKHAFTDQEKRELCVDLSKAVLLEKYRILIPKDMKTVAKLENAETGFYGEAFRIDRKEKGKTVNYIFVTYRGTKNLPNLKSDTDIAIGNIPEQFEDAKKLYENVTNYCKDIKNNVIHPQIIVTGHSLGGSLAQLAAAKYGQEGIILNAPGMKNQIEKMAATDPSINLSPEKTSKIKNYTIETDLIANYGEAIGEVLLLKPSTIISPSIIAHLDFDALGHSEVIGNKKSESGIKLHEFMTKMPAATF